MERNVQLRETHIRNCASVARANETMYRCIQTYLTDYFTHERGMTSAKVEQAVSSALEMSR
jgi:hypothetical protein